MLEAIAIRVTKCNSESARPRSWALREHTMQKNKHRHIGIPLMSSYSIKSIMKLHEVQYLYALDCLSMFNNISNQSENNKQHIQPIQFRTSEERALLNNGPFRTQLPPPVSKRAQRPS